jgi:PAS domain S-box-containing protein
MRFLRRRGILSFLETDSSGNGSSMAGAWSGVYRSSLLVLSLLAFAAHIYVLARVHTAGTFSSNLVQLVLGAIALLAMVEARKRSSGFERSVWSLAALSFVFYSVGQAIFTYIRLTGPPDSPHFGHVIYDPIFFFWIVPLVAAALAEPARIAEGFEWSAILDSSLLVLLALAVHLTIFGDTSRWSGDQNLFWRVKIRLIRDVIVLACLLGRVVFADSPQIRRLFLRLAGFYCAYAMSNVAFLLCAEAAQPGQPKAWIDLVWSIPRFIAVLVAVTWKPEQITTLRPAAANWRSYLLDHAPLVVPLLVLGIGSHIFSSAPWIWGSLIGVTLVVVSLRLRLTQIRQNRALENLDASNNLLHAIIECTSEALYMKDSQGRYLMMNPAGARALNRSPQEVVGRTDLELFPADEAELLRKNDQEVMKSGRTVTVEEAITWNGAQHVYFTTKNAYRDPQGRVIGVVGISVDVTERRRMEQHLQMAQRMESIGMFSSAIAHDFNNILTVIKGYSYLAHADSEENPSVRDNVDQINKAAARASALVDQLLAFSRRQVLQPRVISLNDIVTHLRKMLDRLIGEDVQIETLLATDLGAVLADPCQIEQVLMNLAANARDAMPGGGALRLETANVDINLSNVIPNVNVAPGAYCMLTVSDSGAGMDAQTQARIFEPFFTTKSAGKGTGLGLATAYGIVKQSGGYISVQSKPGAGTTFRIYLPRVNEQVESPSQVTPRSLPEGGGQTILLADDDPQLRQLAKKVLTSSGFTVLESESGEQAEQLAKIHQGAIDLVLTDVVMPGQSGRETVQRIRGDGAKPRVLYMSGYPNDFIARHGVLDPEISFLPKPFTPAGLVKKVREVLQTPSEAA